MKIGYKSLGLRWRTAFSSRSMRLRYRWKLLLTATTAGIVIAFLVTLATFNALQQPNAQASGTTTTQLPTPSTTAHHNTPTPETPETTTVTPTTLTPTTLTPTTLTPTIGPYSFLEPDGQGGTAIRLDPCGGPLVLNYNPAGEGYAAIFDLVRVGQELGAPLHHTVVWHIVGHGPEPDGIIVDISWTPNFADIAPDSPDVVGIGGPEYIGDTIVSGNVQLVTAPTNGLPAPGMGPGEFGTVLAHELGHVVGLDHVNDQTQIMNPSLQPTKNAQYAPGDLTGLHLLGGPCK